MSLVHVRQACAEGFFVIDAVGFYLFKGSKHFTSTDDETCLMDYMSEVPDNIPTNIRRDINVLKSDVWLALENAEDFQPIIIEVL